MTHKLMSQSTRYVTDVEGETHMLKRRQVRSLTHLTDELLHLFLGRGFKKFSISFIGVASSIPLVDFLK
jgi:hypothetical protein